MPDSPGYKNVNQRIPRTDNPARIRSIGGSTLADFTIINKQIAWHNYCEIVTRKHLFLQIIRILPKINERLQSCFFN